MSHDTIDYAQARVERTPDARGRLIAFGVLAILLGAVAAIHTMVLTARLTTRAPLSTAHDMLSDVEPVAGNAALATFLIWVGVDAMRRRRWVGPVVLTLAWLALIAWAFVGVVLGIEAWDGSLLPALATRVEPMVFTAGLTLVGLTLPALCLWLFTRPTVRATLERSSPRLSWPERCDLRVLLACGGLIVAGGTLGLMASSAAAPFFGEYVEGPVATRAVLVVAVAFTMSAALIYAGSAVGWWLALVVIAFVTASVAVTIWQFGPLAFYRWLGVNEPQMNGLAWSKTLSGRAPAVFVAAIGAACELYLFWIRGRIGARRN